MQRHGRIPAIASHVNDFDVGVDRQRVEREMSFEETSMSLAFGFRSSASIGPNKHVGPR